MLRVKEILKEKKISLSKMAEDLGINRVNLTKSLSNNPTYATVRKVADYLDVDIRELFEPTKESKDDAVEHIEKALKILKNNSGSA